MSYWSWWIKRDGLLKIFYIYWSICVIVGFFVLFTFGDDDIMSVFLQCMLLVLHPIGIVIVSLIVKEIAFSYRKYKKTLKKEIKNE